MHFCLYSIILTRGLHGAGLMLLAFDGILCSGKWFRALGCRRERSRRQPGTVGGNRARLAATGHRWRRPGTVGSDRPFGSDRAFGGGQVFGGDLSGRLAAAGLPTGRAGCGRTAADGARRQGGVIFRMEAKRKISFKKTAVTLLIAAVPSRRRMSCGSMRFPIVIRPSIKA